MYNSKQYYVGFDLRCREEVGSVAPEYILKKSNEFTAQIIITRTNKITIIPMNLTKLHLFLLYFQSNQITSPNAVTDWGNEWWILHWRLSYIQIPFIFCGHDVLLIYYCNVFVLNVKTPLPRLENILRFSI